MNVPVSASDFSPENLGEHAYLALLAKVKVALNSAKDVSVPATDIRPYAGQPRTYFKEESLELLSRSIDVGGQTTPGLLRYKPATTPYELIDGERRWRAVMRIPVERRPEYKGRLIEADDDVVQYLISGIANFNREGHTTLEMIDTITRLVSFEIPMEQIALLLGIGKQWAEQIYDLRKLDPNVRRLLDNQLPRREQLPITAAMELSKIEPRHQFALAQRVISKDLPLDSVRTEVVRTARLAGVHIREKEQSPSKKWVSFGTRIDGMFRDAEAVERLLKLGQIDAQIKAKPNADEVMRLLRRLEDTHKSLKASCELMNKKVK